MQISDIEKVIEGALKEVYPDVNCNVSVVPAPNRFGDFSVTNAFALAKEIRKNPHNIAEEIAKHINSPYISSVSVAKLGYINLNLSTKAYGSFLKELEEKKEKYFYKEKNNEKVQVEFVSANPTGPLHIGNGRGGIIGDVLSNVLKTQGFNVEKEYYVNDAGSKMFLFAKSIAYYYAKRLGKEVATVKEGYKGSYIKDIAEELFNEYGDRLLDENGEPLLKEIQELGKEKMMQRIKYSLRKFGVEFDSWFYESSLYKSGEVKKTIKIFEESGYTYEKDSALWFRSTAFGDDKDRVLIRKTGEPTYTLVDAAYHKNKWDRGFRKVIDIWGADHFGHIIPMKALIQGVGLPKDFLDVIIYQIVHLFKANEEVAMSKHTGVFITLTDLINEVGKDAARFFFLLKSSDTHLNFDMDLAKKQSMDNPVYYVQYTYARLKSVLRKAKEENVAYNGVKNVDLSLIKDEERDVLNSAFYISREVEVAAKTYAVHRIPFVTIDFCKKINTFYQKYKVLSSGIYIQPRLALVHNALTILSFLMDLMGIEKKEKM